MGVFILIGSFTVLCLLGMPVDEAGPAKKAAPDYRERYEALTGASSRRCPVCHEGCMQVIEILPPSRRNRGMAITDTS